MTPDRRSELLAAADRQVLLDVADACIAFTEPPIMISRPEVGTISMIVREPVEATRFELGDVLVTRAEIEHRGARGWATIMGADRPAALAAAICDAEALANGPNREAVDELCRITERRMAEAHRQEWRELQRTVVRFEELNEE